MATNWPKPGFKHLPSYMVGGIPYITSSVPGGNEAKGMPGSEPVQVSFPFVTSWICVRSNDNSGSTARDLRIGFTRLGVKNNTHCISIPDHRTGSGVSALNQDGYGVTRPVLFLACTDLFIASDVHTSTEFTLIAGLTNIPRSEYPNLTGSIDGVANFDGVG